MSSGKFIGRFIGVVNTFFMQGEFGFIFPLLRYNKYNNAVPVHRRHTQTEAFVHASDIQSTGMLVKLCSGQVVEYDLYINNDKQKVVAKNVSGVQKSNLPCDLGVLSFKRYQDIDREHNRRNMYKDAMEEGGRHIMDGYS